LNPTAVVEEDSNERQMHHFDAAARNPNSNERIPWRGHVEKSQVKINPLNNPKKPSNSPKPRSSVFHKTKEPEGPTSPKNTLKPRSSKFFQKIKEREDTPSSSASQPPTAARKSFFGFSMRNKVQSADDDLKPKKKKKTNKKKSKSEELKPKNKKTKKQKSHRSLAVPQ